MTTQTNDTAAPWGTVIRDRREVMSLSQRQLAARLDVSQAAVAGWEADRRLPTYRNLARICDVMGLSPSDFLPGEVSA